jgi:transposase
MTHVGLDVGKHKINVFVRYDDGKCDEWEIKASHEDVIRLAKDDLPERSVCAIEASVSTWTIARILVSFGHEVKVLNPADAKADAARQRKKTDKLDARMLCNLLTMSELKTVWIPDEKTERLRMVASHLRKIVKMKTMFKNEIQSILQRHMLLCPVSDLFSESGLFWLKEQEKNLNEEDVFIIKWNLEKIMELKKREDEVVQQMARVCGKDEIVEKALE